MPVERVTASGATLSPELEQRLNAASPTENLRVIVTLAQQLDFGRLADEPSARNLSRKKRWEVVTGALGRLAESQRPLRLVLSRLQRRGLVQWWRSVTVVNAIVVEARAAAVRDIARRPEVASVDGEIIAEAWLESQVRQSPTPSDWPLHALKIETARQVGLDGDGVVVGLIDSGVSARHEQLSGNFRGGGDSWFDPVSETPEPVDPAFGHGTGVLSCAVGRSIGVAPAARWIAAVGLVESRYSNIFATLAADWMLNVGRPDVLIIPWKLAQGCDLSFERVVRAWRAAGIVVIFAAGNSGPMEGTDVSPANYPAHGRHSSPPVAVGATTAKNEVATFSSRGPSQCANRPFPDIVAPGAGVPVAFPLTVTSYRTADGTSFAAGYAAGVAALLIESFPEALPEQIEAALRAGAEDAGAPGVDDAFGFGLLNLRNSLEFLQEEMNSAAQ